MTEQQSWPIESIGPKHIDGIHMVRLKDGPVDWLTADELAALGITVPEPAITLTTTPADSNTDSTVRIVVLQRGWVIVGHYTEDGDDVTIDQASVIRVWGTTKGLGELVDGPLASTKLDKTGQVRAHRGAVVLTIMADENKWAAFL